jgi:hypothetical protein
VWREKNEADEIFEITFSINLTLSIVFIFSPFPADGTRAHNFGSNKQSLKTGSHEVANPLLDFV